MDQQGAPGDSEELCRQFAEEAAAVARGPAAAREQWLAQIAAALADDPRRDAFLASVRQVMSAALAQDEAILKQRYAEERMEANVVDLIDKYADGSHKLPPDPVDALWMIAYVALAGHVIPIVRERIAKPDAQELLAQWFHQGLRRPKSPPPPTEESA